MASNVEDIVGSMNMNITAKDSVIGVLRGLDVDALTKRYLFGRWARLVNYPVAAGDLDQVATL